MVLYNVVLEVASECNYEDGWIFNNKPFKSSEDYKNPLDANKFFDNEQLGLNIIASEHRAGVRLRLYRKDDQATELIRENLYDGEDVHYWLSAYHNNKTGPESRYYIDRVHVHAGYYFFMTQKEPKPAVTIIAVAPDLEELSYQLGEDIDRYENIAE